MLESLQSAIARLSAGQDLTSHQVEDCLSTFLTGQASADEMRDFLTRLHEKGESIAEVVGGARALRKHALPIALRQTPKVDTCGTGGDGSQTFNISTAAALVAAAAGIYVAKHGNRRITSQSGSADVLTELGVEISVSPEIAQTCLDQAGICFLYAPQFHPAMRYVQEVRKQLPFPTLFNLLGPLCNPAEVQHQVLGVGKPGTWDLLVGSLAELANDRCLAVRGLDGLGELSVLATNQVAVITPASADAQSGSIDSKGPPARIDMQIWDPAEFGLAGGVLADIQVPDPGSSAVLIKEVLAGAPGTARNMVVWNAAAAIWLATPGIGMAEAVGRAQSAIDSGAAERTLEALQRASRPETPPDLA